MACIFSWHVLSTVRLGHLMSLYLLSFIISQKGRGFSTSTLSSSPKMRRTCIAVVGVKLCINTLNALRHWFNISNAGLRSINTIVDIVLMWTTGLWLWVIRCPFPSVTLGIWTKLKERQQKNCFFSWKKKFAACWSLAAAALCFSCSFSISIFLDLVFAGVYLVMISCWVLCVCDLTVNRMGLAHVRVFMPSFSCEIVWSFPRIAHQFRPA